MRLIPPLLLLSTTLLPTLAAGEEDGVDAQALVDQSCVSCHGPEVYTRADRRVHSLSDLDKQVRMCEQNLGLRWFDDQVDAVTTLLNDRFYKF